MLCEVRVELAQLLLIPYIKYSYINMSQTKVAFNIMNQVQFIKSKMIGTRPKKKKNLPVYLATSISIEIKKNKKEKQKARQIAFFFWNEVNMRASKSTFVPSWKSLHYDERVSEWDLSIIGTLAAQGLDLRCSLRKQRQTSLIYTFTYIACLS